VLMSYPYTSKPLSLTYFATGNPNCPSPITKTLSKPIFGNASVDPEGYLSSEGLSFNENLEVSAKNLRS
ncbi:MAG: hypothetical protein K0S89_689, partial [Nitrososphaeraceae archaeon]|nr:hypothetical protein [Nitrososphaeraceae archaeon]